MADEIEKVLTRIGQFQTEEEAVSYIDTVIPDWIDVSSVFDRYSKDYEYLQNNWMALCEKLSTEPKRIVIVNYIDYTDQTSIGQMVISVCDYLTKNGYVVRRAGEFVACKKCHNAIPCEELHYLMKIKGAPIPDVWANRCTDC